MNRPGKHCELVVEEMPVARVAGEHKIDGDESKLKRPIARPLDVATRLLQLVSLFVLFVFGLVGASLVTLRHTGMSHPALQRSTSVVVNRLQKSSQHTPSAPGNAIRYSPPVMFSLIAFHQRDGADQDVFHVFATRFAPDFIALSSTHSVEATRSIEQALPGHTCIGASATTRFCFDASVWSQQEHGVYPTESKHQCPWTVSWARFEREVQLRSGHARHWQNETLTVVSVNESPARPTGTTCNLTTTLDDTMDHLRQRDHAPFIIIGLPTAQLASALAEDLVDPFQYLHVPHNEPSSREAAPLEVLASERMRTVSAAVVPLVLTQKASSFQFPVSVVFELLPPQANS